MGKLVIVGASGKLGFATLNTLLDEKLLDPKDIVCTTSSSEGAQKLASAQAEGVEVRSANWDDASSMERAFAGGDKLFLISSARIEKDFDEAPPGQGREADHFRALAAAAKAGIKHVYYTSLAFANPSRSRVMKAHERTEDELRSRDDFRWTIIREGLYNESWPLYLGHYDVSGDSRNELLVGGDSQISWTSIADLGFATALVLAAPGEDWAGKTFYLSQSRTHSLDEVSKMVSKAQGKEIELKVVSRQAHEKYYIEEKGMSSPFIKWWSKTYDALREDECCIHDPTLVRLLNERGKTPTHMEDTIKEMLKG